MRITQLTAENIKRLQAVSITPDGSIVQITGRNGQGKTSVLDSITYALAGKDAVCAKPIRRGEAKAKIVCRLDDLIVTRTFTEDGGGSLVVTNADGAKYPSPQAVLDRMVGRLTLDPLAFSRMAPKQQLEMLKDLVGIDFAALDAERAQVYAERTAVNRAAAQAQTNVDAIPLHPGVPEKEVSVADLVAERDRRAEARRLLQSIDAHETACQETHARREQIGRNLQKRLSAIDDELKQELDRVRSAFAKKRDEAKTQHDHECDQQVSACKVAAQSKSEAQAALKKIGGAKAAADVVEITQQIKQAETVNQKIRDNARRAELEAQARKHLDRASALTSRIEEIDKEKQQALTAAAFPIPDLSFDETGVIFNGIPFSQASSAEQLRASVAIGLAMNPKLRVLLIRDGSLLDADGLKMLAELADEHNAQLWIERVADEGSIGVVIEDGMIATAVAPEPVTVS